MTDGPLTMLLGHLLFGLVPLFLKLGLGLGLGASTAVALRFGVALVLIFSLAFIARHWWSRARRELALAPVNRRGLLWRGVWGGVAVLLYFYAVLLCGAGPGTLLNYTHSLFSNLYSVALGRRKPDATFWPLLALAGLGLWLVVDPAGGMLSRVGIAVGLASGMAGGAAVLTIKTLRQTDNSLTINLALALGGLALSLPLMAGQSLQGQPVLQAPGSAWAWVALSGVFSFGGQYFFNHGFRRTSVPLASLISLTTPVLACFGSWLWLKEPLTPHFLAGALCILAALGLQGLKEGQKRLQTGQTAQIPPAL